LEEDQVYILYISIFYLQQDEFAEATIIGTAAVALQLLGKAESQEQAFALAKQFWHDRPKQKYG